VVPLKKLH